MEFKFAHNNINVFDLDKSIKFYTEALNLKEVRRIAPEDGSFLIIYMGDGSTPHSLELTWMRDRKEPYNLGDNEIHLAFATPDMKAAHDLHEKMGCICYENQGMGIYFIADPDGYWMEVIPQR